MNKRKNEEQYRENRYTDGKHYSKKRGKTEKRISRNNQKIDIRDYQ